MRIEVIDRTIDEARRNPSAPPFLGLIQTSEKTISHATVAVRHFLSGRNDRLRYLFRNFPSLGTWIIARTLNKSYGEAGSEIYPHIETILGVSLDNHDDRTTLHEGFCSACERFGLPTRGFERSVDVYLFHAGVSEGQLHHLVDAFLKMERAVESVPIESSSHMNYWEDEALQFVPSSVRVLRRPIEGDESAWHAELFSRIRSQREKFEPRNDFERCFMNLVLEQERGVGSSKDGRKSHIPRPKLVWQDGEVVLRLPRVSNQIQVWQDDEKTPSRLGGGEHWPIPQPLPRRIRWKIDERTELLEVLPDGRCVVFDCGTGHFMGAISIDSKTTALDAMDAQILARTPFSVNNNTAVEIGYESFIGYAEIGPRPVVLDFNGNKTTIGAKPRRSLTISGEEIAKGPSGKLYGRAAILRVGNGLQSAEKRILRICLGGKIRCVRVMIDEAGFCEVSLRQLLSGFENIKSCSPTGLNVELMTPGTEPQNVRPTGIKLSTFVWPSFSKVEDGIFLNSNCAVNNLVKEHCVHIQQAENGQIHLNPNGGYDVASAVFDIDRKHVRFDFPWPDVSVVRRRNDGTRKVLKVGSKLLISEADRFDTITIKCPDPTAQLVVRGRREVNPFYTGMARNVSVRELLEPASNDRVVLQRTSGVETVLFDLVAAHQPKSCEVSYVFGKVNLCLDFEERVDAVAVEVEDELGEVVTAEAALRHRPVDKRRPEWFQAEISQVDPNVVDVKISNDWIDYGARLARFFVRPEGSDAWQPLRNAHGQSYALALWNREVESAPAQNAARQFETLCRWLADCYADDCRQSIEKILRPRCHRLGLELQSQFGGDRALISAANIPTVDHVPPNWVPDFHPIQFVPSLYGAKPHAFSVLTSNLESGAAEMAAISTLEWTRLRDQKHLHSAIFPAFDNCREADRSGERLRGFSPEQFFKSLQEFDNDPSAGWMWRGSPLLGPAHWRAAHLRFVARKNAAELFLDEADRGCESSAREISLHRLVCAASKIERKELLPSAPIRGAHDEPDKEPCRIECWVSALLSGFARASRNSTVESYLESVSCKAESSKSEALTNIGFLLRLAPELFSFHLLMWEVARERS